MKKNMLGLFIASTFGISVADYRMSVPMEVNNGGSLQNGSITFTGGTPPVVPEVPVTPPVAKDECMPASAGVYAWRVNRTNGAGAAIWNGTTVSTFASGATSVAGPNGIVYTKDETTTAVPQGPNNNFGLCRNIPGDFNGGSWVSIAPVVTAWTNSGSAYNCTWTPDSNNYLPSQSVDQTGINCKQKQVSTSQAREQNDSTLAIRNVGSPTNLNRDIDSDENPTRTVAGTDTTTDAESCVNVAYSSTSWVVDLTDNNNVSYISWMGNTLSANQQLGNVTTFTYNGVTYKRGNYLGELSAGYPVVVYGQSYGICRVNH